MAHSSSVWANIGVVNSNVDRSTCGEHVRDVGRSKGGHGGVGGDVEGGRGGAQERGESTISPSYLSSISSSTSHRHLAAFLVHFAGNREAGGGDVVSLGELALMGGSVGPTGGNNFLGGTVVALIESLRFRWA